MPGSGLSRPPELSVLIAFHNERKFLRGAAESVLRENLSAIEVVAFDDGSTDDSLDTIRDLPVRWHRRESNAGPASARNGALAQARGEWITFLDADDRLVPRSLESRLLWLRNNPEERGVLGSMGRVIGPDGNPLRAFQKVTYPLPPSRLDADFLLKNPSYPAVMWLGVFHRSLMESVGRFDESLWHDDDRDFLIRLLKVSPLEVLPIPCVDYRMHAKNLFFHLQGFPKRQRPLAEATR